LNKLVFLIGRIKRFNLKLRSSFFRRLAKFEHSLRNDSCSMRDSSNLGSEVMLLLSKEIRICDDLPLEVSREEDFDLPGSLDISREEVRETLPVRER
jgi:hypothetical protein